MFSFSNQPSLFDYIIDKIENEWQPNWNMKEERQYRNDLINFLNRHLKKTHRIRAEDGRGLADIGIDGKIGIELKLNLHSKSEIDRLTGQIQDYLEDYDEIIVLLLGKVSPTVVRDVDYKMSKLEKLYEKPNPFIDPFILGNFPKVQSKMIKVIVKSPRKPKVGNQKSTNDAENLISFAKRLESGLGYWGL